jgi:hypothetical protein
MSMWDEIGIASGDFVKFENVGDTVTGTVTALGVKLWDDGTKSPQLELDTDDGSKTLTAGQVRLKLALAEQRPEVGDRIRVELTQIEKRNGGKTLKHFDVKVQRGSAGAAPAPAAAAAAPAANGWAADAAPPF